MLGSTVVPQICEGHMPRLLGMPGVVDSTEPYIHVLCFLLYIHTYNKV